MKKRQQKENLSANLQSIAENHFNFDPGLENRTPPTLQLKANGFPKEEIPDQENGAVVNPSLNKPFQLQSNNTNNTGLPDHLKAGVENLSGFSLDDVKVHYNSSQPAQLQAHAFAQGSDIHVGPGQEKHLPHEAWHIVQQKQGRVHPTKQLKGKLQANDDKGLEKEADEMGAKSVNLKSKVSVKSYKTSTTLPENNPIQYFSYDFKSKVGLKAGITSEHNRAFKKIIDKYQHYKKLEEQENKPAVSKKDNKTNLPDEIESTLLQLKAQCLFYIRKYSDSQGKKNNKKDDANALINLCDQELYFQKVKNNKFKYLTSTGGSAPRHTKEETEYANKYGISKAELTAIKVYTAGDFDYINPAVAENEGWLKAKMNKLADQTKMVIEGQEVSGPSQWQLKDYRKQILDSGPTNQQIAEAKAEGKEHGNMAVDGLKKLKNYDDTDTVYRGIGLSYFDMCSKYKIGKTIVESTFSSTSSDRKKSEDFANSNKSRRNLPVLLTIKAKTGKDISMFSEVKEEKEILLLPGTKLKVVDIKQPSKPNGFYEIELKEE